MGTFRVGIGIGDPQGQQYESLDALVDTGATYTTLPDPLLRRLGVGTGRRVEFELADGSIIEREVGQTWVQINGDTAIVPVVFADEGSAPLLGAVTLETFLLKSRPDKAAFGSGARTSDVSRRQAFPGTTNMIITLTTNN